MCALATLGGGQQLGNGSTETVLAVQATPVAKTAAATLTAAELTNGIITYTGATADITLPTVALLEALLTNAKNDSCFEFIVLDLNGAGRPTIVTATGWTLVSSMAVAANVGARFRARKTGVGTWTLYRMGG